MSFAKERELESWGSNMNEIKGMAALNARVGLSRCTINNMIKLGRFPKPIAKIQEGRKKMNVWRESEVAEWLSQRSAL